MRADAAVLALAVIGLGGCTRDPQVEANSEDTMATAGAVVAAEPMAVPIPQADRASGARQVADKVESALQGSGAASDRVRQADPPPGVLPSPMLIRTGFMSIEVDSVEHAVRLAGDIAVSVDGFVANASIQTGAQSRRSATIEIKVPSARYEGAIGLLHAVGTVESVRSSSEDVSEEFVDVSARVANAHRLEERLVTVLATRTGKLEEVLAVERELARVREEIERYQGRLRYLEAKAGMSSITLNVYEPPPLVGEPGSNVVVEALRQSWRNFVTTLAGGIAAAGTLLPVALVLGAVVLVARRRSRRREVVETGA